MADTAEQEPRPLEVPAELADENYTAELYARFDELLPTLIQAGYADTDDHTWHFTPKGVARADELTSGD